MLQNHPNIHLQNPDIFGPRILMGGIFLENSQRNQRGVPCPKHTIFALFG